MNSDQTESLEYFISDKNGFLVLSLIGPLDKTFEKFLEPLKGELAKSSAQNLILSLHDIVVLEPPAIPPLVKLQMAIRQKPAQLRVCFIRPDFQRLLLEKAAIRKEEITANLHDALSSLRRNANNR